MNSSNCLNHCQLGSLYSDEGLVEAATSYFCRNFEAVSQSQHFLENATVDDLAYFLENETITVKDESIILNTVISWTNFDLENRANNFENLLPFVQWDQLSASDLENFQNQFPKHKGELLRGHPYITIARGLGGFEKWPFLLTFSAVFMVT